MTTKNRINWTEQQKRAITERGSDILVTASAGTGKTAVLSGRCVDIVSDKSVCPDVLSMLVLTFTNAAAEQMRMRITEQLKAGLAESTDPIVSKHLRHQLVLIGGADISTIHSFCKRLITEFFYELGLDPTFRVIEADEQRLLKAEVLEKTIDWAWQQANLRQALQELLYRRDLRENDGFISKVIEASNYLDGVVSRQNWYVRAQLLAEAVNPFATDLGRQQEQIVLKKLHYILAQLQHARAIYTNECPDGNWPGGFDEKIAEPLERCIELLESGSWDKCVELIRDFKKPRINKPPELPEHIAEIVHRTAKKAVDSFEELSELMVANRDYLNIVGGTAGLQTKVLIELVKKFDHFYSQAKRTINCLDFADLEHFALRLLAEEASLENDKLLPSQTTLDLQKRYRYIFVDEYQDINAVQKAIIDLLSSDGNVFVVGDVKQSIYAFRGAEPGIFIDNLKSASADPKNAPTGLRVDLNANFRSNKKILDFVNKIFGRIMTASFSGVDYDQSAQLKPADINKPQSTAKGDDKPAIELHILDEKSKSTETANQQADESGEDENLNIYSNRQRQAAMVAQRIKQMVGVQTGEAEFQVFDKQLSKSREVEYRDIVILLRSLAGRQDFVEILRMADIPVVSETTAGYFEATEISDIVSLLKVLDNPQRDIELAAVLRSPIFNINDTELAKIKIHSSKNRQHNFYNSLIEYSTAGADSELAEKIKSVLEQIGCWRTLARRDANLADLIWQIYRQTNYLSFVSALPNGQSRKANLLKLHDRAIQFNRFASTAAQPSLTRFVDFIEKLQQTGRDWGQTSPETSIENAVRITSIHKSKGLEFPVVFLAELESEFNKRDIYSDLLIESTDTLGLQIIDRRSKTKLSSLAHQVIAEHKLGKALAEEMRILYVATTRARERLVLCACEREERCRQVISNGIFFSDGPIADWQLYSCRSLLDWILYGLSDRAGLHEAFETDLTEKCLDEDLFDLRLYGQSQLKQLNNDIRDLRNKKTGRFDLRAEKPKPKQKDARLLPQLKKTLAWEYKFGDVSLLPAKRSVTQLTHNQDEFVKTDFSGILQRKPKAALSADSVQMPESNLVGSATHLVIANLDLTKPVTKQAIEKTIEKLLAQEALTESVAASVDIISISAFFESELGKVVLDAETIWREWPFTFAMPVSEFSDSGDELIIVQGIIDMLVQRRQELLMIDFKTDRITAGQIPERAEEYRQQLELYGRAVEAILKPQSLSKWLYFLTPGSEFEVK